MLWPGEKRYLDSFSRTCKPLKPDISLSTVSMLKRRRNMYETDCAAKFSRANDSRMKQEKETTEKKVLHILMLMFEIRDERTTLICLKYKTSQVAEAAVSK